MKGLKKLGNIEVIDISPRGLFESGNLTLRNKISMGLKLFGADYAFEYGKLEKIEDGIAYLKIISEIVRIRLSEDALADSAFGC